MASYNLMVGKKAIETSDFSLAHKLFSSGIKFLPQEHWQHHYAVSLELHECAARAALATSNIGEMSLLSEIVLKHARCFDDELYIHQIVILSLLHTSKWDEAFEMSFGILTQLDEGITRNPTEDDIAREVKRTQAMIAGVSEGVILGYRPMTNKKKQAAMKILVLVQRSLYFREPSMCRYYILKMVQLTFTYGKYGR
jgi:predicted ATPase